MFPGETVRSQQAMGMPEDPHAGEFKVMSSPGGAGYYIGTMMLSCGDPNCQTCGEYNKYSNTPYEKGQEIDYNSRETDYFKTRKEAEDALKVYKETGNLPNERY